MICAVRKNIGKVNKVKVGQSLWLPRPLRISVKASQGLNFGLSITSLNPFKLERAVTSTPVNVIIRRIISEAGNRHQDILSFDMYAR